MSRVIVCGSRGWDDIHAIRMRLLRLPPETVIVHGAAPGADTIAAWLAEDFGFTVEPHPAEWEKYRPPPGRKNPAGAICNREMVALGAALVIAFWDGESPGTRDMITVAEAHGIPVERNYPKPTEETSTRS